jgi:hypothetical protein
VKLWLETRTLDYPTGTVSGRFGASVMFVAYSRALAQWFWVYPGGEERIAEPPLVYVDEQWAHEHTLKTPRGKLSKRVNIRRGKGAAQMELSL